MPDALQMLKDDHRKVQDIFKQFERSEDTSEKKRLADEAIFELEIHTQLEEEIFYPAVGKEAQPEDDMMEEAEEEHHVADLLIAELKKMRPQSKNFDAKFTVLAENVKHHIQEEESEMLPKAAELGSERMQELGDEMAARKLELMRGTSRNGSRGRNGAGTRRTTKTRTSKATRATGRKVGGTATRRKTTTAGRSTSRASSGRSNGSTPSRSGNGRTPTRKHTPARTHKPASKRRTAKR